jgi:hypothetical protein
LKEKLNKLFNLIVIKNLVFYNIIAAYFDISIKKKVGVKREGSKRQKGRIKKTKGKDQKDKREGSKGQKGRIKKTKRND